jgi:hypothetical protein
MFKENDYIKEKIENKFSLEKTRDEISARIELASQNPIFENRLNELEDQLEKYTDQFVDSGEANAERDSEEKKIEDEILDSCALAHNLVEFKVMLEALSEKYGNNYPWIEEYLAHENAHSNIASATDQEWIGYATLFIKDEYGNLTGIQPLSISKARPEWGPKEMLIKSIESTNAPKIYGDKLSEGDVQSINKNKERLQRILDREKEDKEKIEVLKNSLI